MENRFTQTWKAIPGYEGQYEITNSGLVKRLYKNNVKSKIISTRINNCGYIEVRLSKNSKSTTKFLHSLLAQTFIPNVNNRLEVNHINGIKTDNHLTNLEWVTHSENVMHAYRTGLLKKVLKPVIDKCYNIEYTSAKEASKIYGINYYTLKNYLNGSRKNPTCLGYKKAA